MKFYGIICSLLVMAFSQGYGQEIALNSLIKVKGPSLFWQEHSIDMGELERGNPANTYFSFTNNGTKQVVIENVKTTCGCTASEYPKEPIAPGKTAKIKVSYNAKNPGAFSKSITVYSNANEPVTRLTIKGVVN